MEGRLVYDIGMHIGQDTAYYLYKGCRVVAVEANPVLAAQGAGRFQSEIASGRLVIENVGIADQPETAEFWVCEEKSEWSSFNRESAARRGSKHHSIQVKCVRLPELIQKHGMPFYMKIDIEGHDRICLQQLSALSSPQYISVESYGVDAVNDLSALGYTKFKVVDQFCLCALEEPPTLSYSLYWGLKAFYRRSLFERKAYVSRFFGKLGGRFLAMNFMDRCRSFGGYVFEDGCSGPYGEDAPGHWKSGADTIAAINKFYDWHRATGQVPERIWFDVHAKK